MTSEARLWTVQYYVPGSPAGPPINIWPVEAETADEAREIVRAEWEEAGESCVTVGAEETQRMT